MFDWLKSRYLALRAKKVKQYRIEEITKTLMIAHASELAHTPAEMWPVTKQRQAQEILAVSEGRIDIVDRRSWALPYLPESLHRLKQPIIKNTPYNIRRFSRTPVPRRAINLIKNAITALEWDIAPIKGGENDITDDQKQRCAIAKKCFMHPNETDSFLQFQEAGIDDMCVNGAFVIEPQLTPDPKRPFKMWTVDSSTIRIFADWKESTPLQPHYAQMTGLKGERGIIVFYDDELIYIKDNPQVDSPFGLGKMEVGFQAINSFLGIQEMSGRAGSDQIHKTWLWWEQTVSPSNIEIVRRHIQNDLEGQAKVSLVAGMKAPTVLDVTPVTIDDLLIPWHEMLIRMIGNAFDMSAMALNLERDINRSTGEVLDDRDFRSAVVPMANRLQEAYTRFILHRLLGWTDLEFKYINMDDPDAETKMVINQQQYATNAITPNEIRNSMGKPKSASPFSDLTQAEMMLIMQEAAAIIQQGQADQQQQRQQESTQQQMATQQDSAQQMSMQQKALGPQKVSPSGKPPKPGPMAASAYEVAANIIQARISKLGGPPAGTGAETKMGTGAVLKMPGLKMPGMKGPSLPKMPIAGSIYNAKEIAGMTASQVAGATKAGLIPPDKKQVTNQMQTQEPGLLDKLSDELKDYFGILEKKQQEDENDESQEITPQQIEEQKARYKAFQHQPPEIERVYNKGLEHNPPDNTLRITKTTNKNYGTPEVQKAFQRGKKSPPMTKNGGKVSKSGGAATGRGAEQDHNPKWSKKSRMKRP